MKKIKFNWGTGVVLFLGGFIILNLVFVLVLSGDGVELVHEEDNYEKGLAYQNEIDMQNNAAELNESLEFNLTPNRIMKVRFPMPEEASDLEGLIKFYKPDNSKLDFTLNILPDSTGTQLLDLSRLNPGKWKLSFVWTDGTKHYMEKREIILKD